MLNKVAAGLATLTTLIHAFVGGHDALKPMLMADLSAPAQAAMHACWHFVTVFFVFSIFVFWTGRSHAKTFAALWVGFGIIFIYVGLTQSGVSGLAVNPQWSILVVTGLLAYLGVRNTAR